MDPVSTTIYIVQGLLALKEMYHAIHENRIEAGRLLNRLDAIRPSLEKIAEAPTDITLRALMDLHNVVCEAQKVFSESAQRGTVSLTLKFLTSKKDQEKLAKINVRLAQIVNDMNLAVTVELSAWRQHDIDDQKRALQGIVEEIKKSGESQTVELQSIKQEITENYKNIIAEMLKNNGHSALDDHESTDIERGQASLLALLNAEVDEEFVKREMEELRAWVQEVLGVDHSLAHKYATNMIVLGHLTKDGLLSGRVHCDEALRGGLHGECKLTLEHAELIIHAIAGHLKGRLEHASETAGAIIGVAAGSASKAATFLKGGLSVGIKVVDSSSTAKGLISSGVSLLPSAVKASAAHFVPENIKALAYTPEQAEQLKYISALVRWMRAAAADIKPEARLLIAERLYLRGLFSLTLVLEEVQRLGAAWVAELEAVDASDALDLQEALAAVAADAAANADSAVSVPADSADDVPTYEADRLAMWLAWMLRQHDGKMADIVKESDLLAYAKLLYAANATSPRRATLQIRASGRDWLQGVGITTSRHLEALGGALFEEPP